MIFSRGLQLVALCSSYLVLGASALAQEAPAEDMVYNMSEVSSLRYECKKEHSGNISCEFLKSAVFTGKISETSADDIKPIEEGECRSYKALLDVLEGRKNAPNPEYIESMSPVSRVDSITSVKALVRLCDKPSEEDKLAAIKVMQDKERRTCVVTAHRWQESFRNVSDGMWVTDGAPEGVCGVVQLNRFEREKTSNGLTFWKYIARKAITNPEADWAPGLKCKEMDEGVYVFDWRPQEHQKSCDYFEFMSY